MQRANGQSHYLSPSTAEARLWKAHLELDVLKSARYDPWPNRIKREEKVQLGPAALCCVMVSHFIFIIAG